MQALSFRSLGVPSPFSTIPADLSDSVGLVPVFKFQEPNGSGVDEALDVRSLGGEKSVHSSTPASLVRRAIAVMLK